MSQSVYPAIICDRYASRDSRDREISGPLALRGTAGARAHAARSHGAHGPTAHATHSLRVTLYAALQSHSVSTTRGTRTTARQRSPITTATCRPHAMASIHMTHRRGDAARSARVKSRAAHALAGRMRSRSSLRVAHASAPRMHTVRPRSSGVARARRPTHTPPVHMLQGKPGTVLMR